VSFEVAFVLACVTLLLAAAASVFWAARSPRRRRSRGERFARDYLVWVDPPMVGDFDEALARRLRCGGWLLVLMALTVGALSLVGDPIWGDLGLMIAFTMLIAGLPIAGLLASWVASRNLPSGTPAALRRAPELADYVPRYERVMAWVVAVGSLVVGVMTGLSRNTFPDAPSPWVSALPCLAVAAAVPTVELLARRLAAQPLPALDAAQLYWQDALRAELLRRSYQPLILSVVYVWQWSGLAVPWHRGPLAGHDSEVLLPVGALAITLGYAVLFLAHQEQPGTRWFRRRLWPSLEPWQVVRPGDHVPAG